MSFGFGLGLPRATSSGGGGPAFNLNFTAMSTLPSSIAIGRSTNATYYDSTGTLTVAPNNLAQRSQTFNTAPWFPQFATAAENADIAPDGTQTATRWTSNSGVSSSWDQQALVTLQPGTYIVSVYAKAAVNAVGKNFGPWLWANGTGTLVGGGNGQPGTWSTLTADWVRYSRVVNVATAGSFTVRFDFGYPSTSVGDAISVWGYQCEQVTYQTTPSTYIATTNGQYFGPRFECYTDRFSQQNLWCNNGLGNSGAIASDSTLVLNAAVAPDGTTTATKVVEGTTNALHGYQIVTFAPNQFAIPGWFYTISAGGYQPYTISFYVKAAGRNYITVGGYGLNGRGNTFAVSLIDGSVLPSSMPTAKYTVTNVGNGWWYCTISDVYATLSNFVVYANNALGSATYTGDGVSGIYVWNFQLSANPTPLPYLSTGNAPASVCLPRGMLVETASTNQILYGSDYTNAAWAKTNVGVITATGITAPDGSITQSLYAIASVATNFLNATNIITTGTTYTYSVHMRQGSSATVPNAVLLRNNTTATNLLGVTVNLVTGAITYTTGSSGASTQYVGNGWWRVSLTVSTGITVGDGLFTYVGWTGGTATAGDNVYVWGAQLEAQAWASSYIPTYATATLRSNDDYNESTSIVGSFGRTEGSWYVYGDTIAPSGVARTALNNGAANHNYAIVFQSNGEGAIQDGTNQVLTSNVVTVGNTFKLATTYSVSANNMNACLNGGTVATSAAYSNSFAADASLRLGAYGYLNGHLQVVQYYPYVLTNTQLQTFTYAQYLLLENNNRFLLENSSGDLMLG
jgi:hypothetical protein